MRNQNEAVLVHYKAGISVSMSKKKHFYDKEISILCITLSGIASSDIDLLIKHSRYFTKECCLIYISHIFRTLT